MPAQSVRWTVAAIVSAVLVGWPFIWIKHLKPLVPPGVIIGGYGISLVAAVIMLAIVYSKGLREQGREWIRSAPAGIAGRSRGLIVHRAVVPISIAGVLIGLSSGRVKLPLIVLLALGGLLFKMLFEYVKAEIAERRQKRSLQTRPTDYLARSGGKNLSDCETEALAYLSKEFSVPVCKLGMQDRFGSELGTLSVLDTRLDRVGGALRVRFRGTGHAPSLSDVVTVKDFIAAWCAERGIPDDHEGE